MILPNIEKTNKKYIREQQIAEESYKRLIQIMRDLTDEDENLSGIKITKVRAKGLQVLRIYVDGCSTAQLKSLNGEYKNRIRHLLGKSLQLRYSLSISFYIDTELSAREELENLLHDNDLS